MLTRDLIKYQSRSEQIQICWLHSNQGLAEFIAFAREHLGASQQDFHQILDSYSADPLQDHLKGLVHVLMDYCPKEEKKDLWQERLNLALRAQKLRQDTLFESHEAFGDAFASECEKTLNLLRQDFFADLPEKRAVTSMEDISPDQLMDAYHMAAVQGILIFTKSLVFKWEGLDLSEKRSLFRGIKFNKLLAQVLPSGANELCLQVSGPLDLFAASSQYGLELARFLHWATAPKKWEMSAIIQFPKQKSLKKLCLNEKSPLQSSLHLKGLYRPQELSNFCRQLTKNQEDWQVEEGKDILHLGGQNYLIPDFEFAHTSGKKIYLELFHKWHQSGLMQTLHALEKNPDKSVLLGVSRALIKDASFAKKLEDSKVFQKYGFYFKDFPTSKTVLEMLSRF